MVKQVVIWKLQDKCFGPKLGIPGKAVYVTYHPVNDWDWNGSNF